MALQKTEVTKRTKFCLVSISNSHNIGARILCSWLRHHGFETSMIFLSDIIQNDIIPPSEQDLQLMFDLLIKEIKPDVVGISVSCSSLLDISKRTTEVIRQALPNTKVLWGGIHAILLPESCIDIADYVCVGEGEEPLIALANAIEDNTDTTQIDGLWARVDGQVYQNGAKRVVDELDTLTYPDYTNDKKYFIYKGKLKSQDPFQEEAMSLFVLTSRGCPFHCTFCAAPIFLKEQVTGKVKGNTVRQRSVEDVMQELEYVKSCTPLFEHLTINFADDVFVLDKAWVNQFVQEYSKRFGNPFWCYFHPNTVREEIVEEFKGVGMRYINMGVQNGSERIRKDIFDRTDTNKIVKRAVEIIQKHGIGCMMDIIVDNPFDTEDDKQIALEFFLSLPRPFKLNYLSMIYFPSVRFTELALKAGFITEDHIEMKAKKTFYQMNFSFDWTGRKPSEKFWTAIFHMTGKGFISHAFLRSLSRNEWLKKHPEPVVVMAKAASQFLFLEQRAELFWKRLMKGDVKWSQITYAFHKYARAGIPYE
ncbi:MAG: radical SAM protein [bacterium]